MKSPRESVLYSLAGITAFLLLPRIEADSNSLGKYDPKHYCPGPNAPIDFTDFDNRVGMENGCYIVPNYIHFVRFLGEQVNYLQMICILAAYKRQKPEKIYFHYDNETTFTGKYWEILNNYPGFMDVVELVKIDMPTEIFGQKLSDGWRVFHASDVTRVRVLMKYGGIFLDNDVYLVKPIHSFRRFEMAVGWDNLYHPTHVLGNQLLIAHKDARFLNLYIESYRGDYNKDVWYYNGGERPSQEIIKNQKLAHVVHYMFGNDNWITPIYLGDWLDWNRHFYAIHILIRIKSGVKNTDEGKRLNLPAEFDENNILNLNITLRKMCLDVYNPE